MWFKNLIVNIDLPRRLVHLCLPSWKTARQEAASTPQPIRDGEPWLGRARFSPARRSVCNAHTQQHLIALGIEQKLLPSASIIRQVAQGTR